MIKIVRETETRAEKLEREEKKLNSLSIFLPLEENYDVIMDRCFIIEAQNSAYLMESLCKSRLLKAYVDCLAKYSSNSFKSHTLTRTNVHALHSHSENKKAEYCLM